MSPTVNVYRGQVGCRWFARCDLPADGIVKHPILGDVPTCKRCAGKLGLDLIEGDWIMEVPEDTDPIALEIDYSAPWSAYADGAPNGEQWRDE